MRVAIIAVGKVKEAPLRSVVDDYLKRIRRYCRFEEIELKDGPVDSVEARFVRATQGWGRTVALEVDGDRWSSQRLATELERCAGSGDPSIAFLIGGSYGLPPAVSRGAHLRLSLSDMTLPHRLARLVLAEQIYRGFSILRGEPYSH